MKRVIYVNENRTILVEAFVNEAVAEIIEGEMESVTVARRPDTAHTWGPPIPCTLEV